MRIFKALSAALLGFIFFSSIAKASGALIGGAPLGRGLGRGGIHPGIGDFRGQGWGHRGRLGHGYGYPAYNGYGYGYPYSAYGLGYPAYGGYGYPISSGIGYGYPASDYVYPAVGVGYGAIGASETTQASQSQSAAVVGGLGGTFQEGSQSSQTFESATVI